ncbi:MAG: DUF2336 domain-containing protein [Rickettsiales bacterium]|nr:DUF2336 domain-containing protein [Pseudomonadota bacterium]MDA0966110.1 DUF2336 domain-containing protein [Pseudomonadota bacterium]MDG4543225.1 DUF2336 domain-containing protein [Rickettsiales bacterium]MDG4545423.1 DUF2336 domain-containing protein [Rickettsiales bacterium]MDG4547872.1 DUF2336 domain-containing protein [Rickettsiales bacterium]
MSLEESGNRYELTDDDIQKLIKSPFEKKIDITKKIADYYNSGGFSQEQMVAAARIFGTLVKDTEVKIRKTLSEAIKDNPDIPRDIILSLAHDVQEVSLPVLEFSDVLTDADLIEIVTSTEDAEKQKSISKRHTVSEGVAEVLIETDNEAVVDTLLQNEGVRISEESIGHIVETFGEKEEIMGALVERETLPVSIVESLADKISESLYNSLQEKHKDAFVRMDDMVRKSRDVAKMKLIGLRSTDAEYYKFCQLMERLKIPEELSPIYALCMSNMNIFEVKIARLTQTPVLNIRQLVRDSSNKGFRVLYRRAGLPKDLFEASEVLITALRSLESKYASLTKRENHLKTVAQELRGEILKKVKNVEDVKNLDYVLSLVNHYSSMHEDNGASGS